MTATTMVIVGASLAGAKAAEGARDAGFEGAVVLVGDEPGVPYERPPLSKDILRGDKDPDAARVHADGFYEANGIELVTDHVSGLDLDLRRVELRSGGSLHFDVAVLATGAAPRRLRIPGADLPGVHLLRTLDDSLRLGDAVRHGSRVAVIGAGWIGSEVAASARQMGAEVLLVDAASVPLQRVLGDDIGGVFRDLHADHGVELRLGRGIRELRGSDAVEEVVLDDGSVEAADVVVIGVGVAPRTQLAEAAGLHVDDGIVTDQHLRTSHAGVHAAGDVASAWHPRYGCHLRVEHWANALNQGTTAGRNAAGERETYDRLPYFFSDQYDLGMEYLGHASSDDSLVVRGDLGTRAFVAFWLSEGVVTAAMHANVWDATEALRGIVEHDRPLDPARLADPTVELADVVQ